MSLIDAKLMLSEQQEATSTASTTNTLDFGNVRELFNNYHGAGYLNIRCVKDVAGTGLTFELKDSADNSSFNPVAGVGTLTLTSMKAGDCLTVKLPKTRRYVKGDFTADSITAGTFDVFVGQPEV